MAKFMKDAKNQKGFVNAMENFDVAVAELAGKSAAIFANKGVAKAMGEFIRGTRNALLIYGPTPEIPGKVSPFRLNRLRWARCLSANRIETYMLNLALDRSKGAACSAPVIDGAAKGICNGSGRIGIALWAITPKFVLSYCRGSYHYHCAK
ncbi:hypothetical protein [Comamonas sp. JC664]|uniref:hypothetical protein n=1 Tax=Comamonas sp. JC664 TaxID=2801917 RepID=UPI0036181FCC